MIQTPESDLPRGRGFGPLPGVLALGPVGLGLWGSLSWPLCQWVWGSFSWPLSQWVWGSFSWPLSQWVWGSLSWPLSQWVWGSFSWPLCQWVWGSFSWPLSQWVWGSFSWPLSQWVWGHSLGLCPSACGVGGHSLKLGATWLTSMLYEWSHLFGIYFLTVTFLPRLESFWWNADLSSWD